MQNILLVVKKFDRIRICRYKDNKIILELLKVYSYQKKDRTYLHTYILICFTGIITIIERDYKAIKKNSFFFANTAAS